MNNEQWEEFSKNSGTDLDRYMYHNLLDMMAEVIGCTDREADIIHAKLREKNISVLWRMDE